MHEVDTGRFDTSRVRGIHALVIGGTTVIGRAVVHMLASLGAEVVTTASDDHELDALLMDSERFGFDHVTGLRADLATEQGRDRIFGFLDERWSDLDALVITAGFPADVRDRGPHLAGIAGCIRRSARRMPRGGAIFVVGTAAPAPSSGVLQHAIELDAGLEAELAARDVAFTVIEAATGCDDPAESGGLDPFDVATALLFCLIQPARSDVVAIQMRPRRLAPI